MFYQGHLKIYGLLCLMIFLLVDSIRYSSINLLSRWNTIHHISRNKFLKNALSIRSFFNLFLKSHFVAFAWTVVKRQKMSWNLFLNIFCNVAIAVVPERMKQRGRLYRIYLVFLFPFNHDSLPILTDFSLYIKIILQKYTVFPLNSFWLSS